MSGSNGDLQAEGSSLLAVKAFISGLVAVGSSAAASPPTQLTHLVRVHLVTGRYPLNRVLFPQRLERYLFP